MRTLLSATGVALAALVLAATLPPRTLAHDGKPSPSPSPDARPSPSPSPSKFNDEDLARYRAAHSSPSPAPSGAPAPGKSQPQRLPPLRGTAATGTAPPPLRGPVRTAPTPVPSAAPSASSQEGPGPTPAPATNPQAGPEQEWRRRSKQARGAVEAARANVARAELEANGLFTRQIQSTDTNEIMQLRQEVAEANERIAAAKEAVRSAETALADLQEEARKEAIPPSWLVDDGR